MVANAFGVPDTITFGPCRDLVDDWILPSEPEIADGIRRLVADNSTLAEGAGALSVASLLQHPERFAGRTVVCVISGSRIPLDTLAQVLG